MFVVLVIVAVIMARNHSKSFDGIKSRQALAERLNCDVSKALDYVIVKTPQEVQLLSYKYLAEGRL
jgi:hypothetical protein